MSKVSTAALTWLGLGPKKPPPLADLSDEALVQAAMRADGERPFGELLRRHEGKVRGLLLRLTTDRNLADDLAQEVFLRAYRGLCGFEGRARFSTWLRRRRTSRPARRRRSRR